MISTIPVRDGPQPAWLDHTIAAVVAATATACTVLLARATPDPRGYDTHTQLGLPRCGWPGAYGIPCPTCGATTAACHVVHGHPIQALLAHPFGAAIATAGLLLAVFALYCLLRRRSFLDLFRQVPLGSITVGGVALLLLSWLYKYLTFTPP